MPAIQKNVSFPESQLARIQELANRTGKTFSKIVQMLCDATMEDQVAFGNKFNTIVEIPKKPEVES